MIVIDTSALMAIVLDEPGAAKVEDALDAANVRLMSAATLAEALIVARRRGVGEELSEIVQRFDIKIVTFSEDDARSAARTYDRYGRGVHPAKLNLGDCFAYGLAHDLDAPLAFVGEDFARTDIVPAA